MPTTAKQLIEAANAAVPKISGKEAQEMVANGAVTDRRARQRRGGADRQGRRRAPHPARAARVQGRPKLAHEGPEFRRVENRSSCSVRRAAAPR